MQFGSQSQLKLKLTYATDMAHTLIYVVPVCGESSNQRITALDSLLHIVRMGYKVAQGGQHTTYRQSRCHTGIYVANKLPDHLCACCLAP